MATHGLGEGDAAVAALGCDDSDQLAASLWQCGPSAFRIMAQRHDKLHRSKQVKHTGALAAHIYNSSVLGQHLGAIHNLVAAVALENPATRQAQGLAAR